MAIRHGIVASGVSLSAPTVSVSNTTNFNQDRATFNGTVSANGSITTVVKFQISTNNSTWTDASGGITIQNTSSQNVSVFYNATGLSVGTFYYVRLVATNAGGTSESSSTTFTTWALQVYERSVSGGTTFTIPTITPVGGSELSVSIYDIIMFGSGGGANSNWAGGGGGYVSQDSASLSGGRSVTTSVAAGGAGASGANAALLGAATTITGNIATLSAPGGGGAQNGSDFYSGSAGNGYSGNPYRVEYDPTPDDKNVANYAYGGGGGANGYGGNPVVNNNVTQGGSGGAGVQISRGGVTVGGGAGGGGAAYQSSPTSSGEFQGAKGAYNTYGSGGNAIKNGTGETGQNGYIRFRYYAASPLA